MIAVAEIKKKIKDNDLVQQLKDAIYNATDIEDIKKLESLLKGIDNESVLHIKVISAVSKKHGGNKSDLIKQIIKVLSAD